MSDKYIRRNHNGRRNVTDRKTCVVVSDDGSRVTVKYDATGKVYSYKRASFERLFRKYDGSE